MTFTRKQVFARVSLPNGQFLTEWHDIAFQGYQKVLNAGPGECVLGFDAPFDYDSNDLAVGNDVEVIIADRDTIDGSHDFDGNGTRTIYKGYISLIERAVDGPKETVTVHLLGYYTLLSLDILKNGSQTTLYSVSGGLTTTSGSQAAADIGAMARAVIDRYRAENTSPKLFYNGSGASVGDDIPDTSTTATYTFQRKTYREALDALKALAPEGVYWYADETGRITFKSKPTTPTHAFVFGKHFSSVRIEESLEKVRNFYLMWDGNTLHKHYQDDASIALYGRRAEAANDYGIANSNAADELGTKFLAENKQPQVKVVCTIIDNADGVKGYDIETIQPGDTCRFTGFSSGLSDVFSDNMLITSVDYALDRVVIEVEIVRSTLLDIQSKHSRSISEITSGGLGVPATYS